jgi:hypothetical protein
MPCLLHKLEGSTHHGGLKLGGLAGGPCCLVTECMAFLTSVSDRDTLNRVPPVVSNSLFPALFVLYLTRASGDCA